MPRIKRKDCRIPCSILNQLEEGPKDILDLNKNAQSQVYQCIKTSLKSIIREDSVRVKIEDAALRANNIVVHTLQFLKLYLIYCYDNNIVFPTVNRHFVTTMMKTMCKKTHYGRPCKEETNSLTDTLGVFLEAHYKSYIIEEMSFERLSTVLDYLAIDVITMFENNIKQHFSDYIQRFIDVTWRKKELINIIKKYKKTVTERQKAISKLCNQLKKVKEDLLSPGQERTSHHLYHLWINDIQCKVLPQRLLQKDSINYDLQCSPQDYLPCMFYMVKKIEAEGASLFNVCPLRSEIIPKHFRLDTSSLVHLCFTPNEGKRKEFIKKGNLITRQDEIWSFFFKTKKKCFHIEDDRHKYTFDHQIETDGVSCSILLKRKDLIRKRVRESKAKEGINKEVYIDEVEDYNPLKDKQVIAIDPNMSDLLYCVNNDKPDQVKFRYTQNTRRKETKVKKYRNYLQMRKKEIINGKRVEQWEAELSAHNKKTLDFAKFKAYIQKKNEINAQLAPFYNEYLFRKFKLGSYIRRQITEARLLKRFEKLFGGSKDTIIAIGDWDQHQHRKYKEPVKGIGFRTLFRGAGYKLYLVDEFRTSCRCSFCGGECEKFRWCENPRPYRTGRILRHGLVKCKTCSRLWNRDTNAASNIWKIAVNAIRGEERPEYLRRV